MQHRVALPGEPVHRTANIVIALLGLIACSRSDSSRKEASPPMTAHTDTVVPTSGVLVITSSAFATGDTIPKAYTCDGANRSPSLSWTGAPARTAAWALIVEDPDAAAGTFIHWILYDIPGATTSVPEGIPPGGTVPQLGNARQGRTSFGAVGYGGPCPPPGSPHHYNFRLFALDAKIGLDGGATSDQVSDA